MGKFYKNPIFVVVVALALAGGFVFWRAYKTDGDKDTNRSGDAQNTKEQIFIGEEKSAAIEPSKQEGKKLFTHKILGFSFEYPEELSVGDFREGEYGEMVLVQGNSADKQGFQIFVNPLDDEDTSITPERIEKDLPGTVVRSPQAVTVDGAEGLMFLGSASYGPSREIWFVHNGYLYQVSGYAEFSDEITRIMGTWKFLY